MFSVWAHLSVHTRLCRCRKGLQVSSGRQAKVSVSAGVGCGVTPPSAAADSCGTAEPLPGSLLVSSCQADGERARLGYRERA